MFEVTSLMKIGHEVEYAFDVFNRKTLPFVMMNYLEPNAITISTNMGEITVSRDTQLQTSRGVWKFADKFCVGQSLKHVSGNAVINAIWNNTTSREMYSVCDTDYVIVNGFYLEG